MFHCELPSVQLTERYNKFIVLNGDCDYLSLSHSVLLHYRCWM